MSEKRRVLITGVSSGIGQATARLLSTRGYIVYGACRRPSSIQAIPEIEMLPLDVCSDESVKSCLDACLSKAGRLDVLINNAGYGLRGAIEEATLQDVKAQFETNLFGVIRMLKGILPIMRKQGDGQIINVSSVAGLVTAPFVGYYCSSKFALEGCTEALRHEVKPFNIRVSLIEPGFVRTKFWENQQQASERISDYDPWRQRVIAARQQLLNKASEPSAVAETILHILESKSPRLRYIVGSDSARMLRLKRFLPEALFEKGVRRNLNLDIMK